MSVDWYDQALWVARQREQRALRWADKHRPELAAMHREADEYTNKQNVQAMIEHHAACVAQAWERELDTEESRAAYGLIPVQRKELTVRHGDNVIAVDFRAPRTARGRTGR